MSKGRKVPGAFPPIRENGRVEDVESHRAFITANGAQLFVAAQSAYQIEGRGAFVSLTKDGNKEGTPAAYLSDQKARSTGVGWPDEATAAIINDYDPAHEFVVIVVRLDGGASAYRVHIIDGKPVLAA